MSRRAVRAIRVAAIVSLCAALSACGWGDSDASAEAAKGPGPKVAAAPKQRTMVAAVSGSRTPGAVDLRFLLSNKPAVGQPLDIQFAITPMQDLQTLFIRFIAAGDGLEVTQGAETKHLEHPAVGASIDHTVRVIPKSDGIYYLTAVVVSDSDTESVSRNYSIPIIAGEGISEPPPAAAARPESASR
jgi:hypothetical protein